MKKLFVITSGKGGVGKSLGYSEYVALANGDVIQIGPYIDNLIENNKIFIKQLLVQTSKGNEIFEVLEPPQDLILNIVKNPSDSLLLSEINNPIALMRKPAPNSLIRVTTPNGPIEVTEEHKFITLRDGNLIKLRADELTEKDYLLEFNYPPIIREYEDADQNKAKLLGYLIGDGYLQKRNNNFLIHIFCEEKNKELIGDVLKKSLGDFKILKDKRTGVIRISYFKTEKINKLISEYGVVPKTSEEKEIPKKIFKTKTNICASFISALFDCDGHVCKNRNEIQYDTKSEKLAYQISNLLRARFKIESQLKLEYRKHSNLKEKQKYFRIIISGEDILKFYHQINFNVPDKKERLEQKIKSQKYNTNIKLFPVGRLIRIIRESSGISAQKIADILGCSKQMIYEYEWGFYALSTKSLKNFLRVFKNKNVSHEKIEFLENLINKGYSFRKIQKIERVPYNHPYVYDFQICEEGGHFTHATGIVISNTTTAINLGAAINFFGRDVLVVDGNLTTPNIGIHLNSPQVPITLNHVLLGKAELFESVYEHESGMKVIPASLSVRELRRIRYEKIRDFKDEFKKISDYVIVDSSAGLGNEALLTMRLADELIIVTNPEIPAVTDALKTIKLAEQMKKKIFGVIVTRVKKNKTEMRASNVKEMLEAPILGMIPEDPVVQEALNLKDAVIHTHPKSKISRAYKEIAAKILNVEYDSRKERERMLERLLKKLGLRK